MSNFQILLELNEPKNRHILHNEQKLWKIIDNGIMHQCNMMGHSYHKFHNDIFLQYCIMHPKLPKENKPIHDS
ncbi:hypothetical protein LguiA_010540 [Lonicera macranthoides]